MRHAQMLQSDQHQPGVFAKSGRARELASHHNADTCRRRRAIDARRQQGCGFTQQPAALARREESSVMRLAVCAVRGACRRSWRGSARARWRAELSGAMPERRNQWGGQDFLGGRRCDDTVEIQDRPAAAKV
jgi:hypothetical protein